MSETVPTGSPEDGEGVHIDGDVPAESEERRPLHERPDGGDGGEGGGGDQDEPEPAGG